MTKIGSNSRVVRIGQEVHSGCDILHLRSQNVAFNYNVPFIILYYYILTSRTILVHVFDTLVGNSFVVVRRLFVNLRFSVLIVTGLH